MLAHTAAGVTPWAVNCCQKYRIAVVELTMHVLPVSHRSSCLGHK